MPKFGPRSTRRLRECRPDLQRLFNEVVRHIDCTVLCGYRNEEDQTKAFEQGYSKAKWGQSKHNTLPSNAADVIPYPVDWDDIERFERFVAQVKFIAVNMNIEIRCGADFTTIRDFPHYELID